MAKLKTKLVSEMKSYNNIAPQQGHATMSYEGIRSGVWAHDEGELPYIVKKGLLSLYQHIQRMEEELDILKSEIACVVKYYKSCVEDTTKKINELSGSSKYDMGLKCLMNCRLLFLKMRLNQVVAEFKAVMSKHSIQSEDLYQDIITQMYEECLPEGDDEEVVTGMYEENILQ